MTAAPVARTEAPAGTEIVRVRITPEKTHLRALVDLVTDLAEANDISEKDAKNLDRVLLELCESIVRHGFEGERTRPIEITISRRVHALVVTIEDKGIPFDFDSLEQGSDGRFHSYLSRHYADEVNFQSLGRNGNRTEIVKNLPHSDVRSEMDIAQHHRHVEAPAADPDEPITVGMLDRSTVHDLVRLVFRCYGYTYVNDFMYKPEQIEALIDSGLMLSGAAYNSKREIIGHVGLIASKPGARVAESGEAIVDPRYRGRGIFQQVKSYLLDYVTHHDVVGTYGECVTVHPYSQKGSLDLGGHETGFLLGYVGGEMKFTSISEHERPHRQSVAMMFTPLAMSAPGTIHLPQVYGDLAAETYRRIGFERHLVVEGELARRLRRAGSTMVTLRHDLSQAMIQVDVVGRRTLDEIRFQLKHLTLGRFDCIYADLPLSQPGAGYVASELRKLGFFYGCIIREYRDGDVLRMQYLNNVEIIRDDIKTASDFGERLLGLTFEEMEAATGLPRLTTAA